MLHCVPKLAEPGSQFKTIMIAFQLLLGSPMDVSQNRTKGKVEPDLLTLLEGAAEAVP